MSEVSGRRNPVARAVAVVEHFVVTGAPELGLRELASQLGWPPSTLQRILALLEEENLVSFDATTQRYRLGLRVLATALAVPRAFPVATLAVPVMQRLVEACQETALLALYDRPGWVVTHVKAVECSQSVRFVADVVGESSPLYAGAAGLAVLAFLEAEEIERYLDGTQLRPFSGRTITDRAVLEGELDRVRRRGFVRSSSHTAGAVGLAAPITGPDGLPVASVQLTMPEYRFDASREDELGHAVRAHAEEISTLLSART